MSRPRITRRRALALGLGLGASALGAIVLRRTAAAPSTGAGRPALREALDSVLSDPEATRRLGVAYLEREPREASIDLLLRRLPLAGRTPDETEAATVRDPLGALARIGAAATGEFSRGETVIVSGWQLGRSEARLAALCAALRV